MNKLSGVGVADRARALQPLIASEADEIERTRRLTPKVTAALIENELYRALLPRSVGGLEVPLESFMQMQEEIAKADASTAWCLGQCAVCAMTAAYLEPDAANEIFNTPPGILAWGAINHEVKVVPGGYIYDTTHGYTWLHAGSFAIGLAAVAIALSFPSKRRQTLPLGAAA